MSALSIGIAIHQILQDSIAGKEVEGRVFPINVKDDISFPYIVYQRSVESNYTKDGYSVGDDVLLSVIIASDKYSESVKITELVREALESYKGTVNDITIKSCRLIASIEDGVAENYMQGLTFKIKTK